MESRAGPSRCHSCAPGWSRSHSCLCLQEHGTREGHGHGQLQRVSGSLEHGSVRGQFQQHGRCWLRSCHSRAKVRTSAPLLSKRATHGKKILHRNQQSQIIPPGPRGNNTDTVQGVEVLGMAGEVSGTREGSCSTGTSTALMFNPELTGQPGVYLFKLNTNPQTMLGSEINVR